MQEQVDVLNLLLLIVLPLLIRGSLIASGSDGAAVTSGGRVLAVTA